MDDVLLALSMLAIGLGLLGIGAIFVWECYCRIMRLLSRIRFSLATALLIAALAPPFLAGVASIGYVFWVNSQIR